ncbi:HTH-type transcriptional regulator GltR [Saezia sanguinis]|uniref:HTH-type transcriptional regulator GltR n=1 Tax=Saezia sanguinis TaxID=1965230 RepID=A0A433SBQ3_9BURK|nr:LysR family transcriptional regulator [Saezia sanguinis]RUS66167.1 HTH-type transcriptional regulator GltR [Saezia sanguinis]
MEIADLKTLIAVVEKGGITRAAEALHRVPSGITTRIRQLEETLGVKLFLREGKRLLPTAQGQILYRDALRVVALMQEAENRVRDVQPGGRFRVGAMESTAAARLPEPLSVLYARYPLLELDLCTGTSLLLYEMLLANELDAVLVADAPADARLDRQNVFTEELVLVAPAGHPPIHVPQDIQKKNVLAFKEGCSYRRRLNDWFAMHGAAPERIAELASYHAILGGIAAGMGVGVMPAQLLNMFPDRNALTVHRLNAPFSRAVTELVWRKNLFSANILALQTCLLPAETLSSV